MNFNVSAIPPFEKQAKRLFKKFPSLKTELADLVATLKSSPNTGIALGNDCFKIRLSIASKGKGKSGGARVITYFAVSEGNVFLLSIYDKSEQHDLPAIELQKLLYRVQ